VEQEEDFPTRFEILKRRRRMMEDTAILFIIFEFFDKFRNFMFFAIFDELLEDLGILDRVSVIMGVVSWK